MTSLSAQLGEYREKRAQLFASRSRSTFDSKFPVTSPAPLGQLYKRHFFPGLASYLAKAAKDFRERRHASSTAHCRKERAPQTLGHGEPIAALLAEKRRERWMRMKAERIHRIRTVTYAAERDYVRPGGIPADVCRSKHERWLEWREKAQIHRVESVTEMVVGKLESGSDEFERVWSSGIRVDKRGYAQYTRRAREEFQSGKRGIFAVDPNRRTVIADTFEEVKRRYAGRPDEIYRRKTARKFARWRRQKLEREAQLQRNAMRAEEEMKRRRGYDHLQTDRRAGDSSFAPFLYELDENAYAYSSKITEAPKLRKVMIQKYSTGGGKSESDGWERAHLAAEKNPLFHTRVMNRFT